MLNCFALRNIQIIVFMWAVSSDKNLPPIVTQPSHFLQLCDLSEFKIHPSFRDFDILTLPVQIVIALTHLIS